jgi:hypothetical protein
MTTLSSYLQISTNLSKWQSITAKSSEVAVQTKYFEDNIGKVSSIDEFMKDTRLFNYAMTAFGLGDMTYAKGMMKKVLEEGVADSGSLANTLLRANVKSFAETFDFAAKGEETTSDSTLVDNVVARYTETALETDQGESNPGVQLALYFQRQAPNITNVYGILADKNLLTVVQTALGISSLTAAQSVDTQANLLKKAIDLDDFKDPTKLQRFIQRFAAMYDYANGGDASSEGSLVATLFSSFDDGSSSGYGIDASLLLSLQTAKNGFF